MRSRTSRLAKRELAGTDIFVAKINTNSAGADSLVFSTYYGATNFDEAASGVVVDAEGNVYATGFPFRIIFTGIIHTGRQVSVEALACPAMKVSSTPLS